MNQAHRFLSHLSTARNVLGSSSSSLFRNRIFSRNFEKPPHIQVRNIVIGHALPSITKTFVSSSDLSLYHKIEVPGLYINPFIVQPSAHFVGKSTREHFYHYEHAVRTHRSNCLCVYRHDGVSSDSEWYFRHMDQLLTRNGMRREQVVLMAHIGISVFPNQDIEAQIERVKALCSLSHIDIVILQMDSISFEINDENMERSVMALEHLCDAGELHCYGMHLQVAPYCYHSPSRRSSSAGATVPLFLEGEAGRELPHLDIFMYPLSPTTRIPATFPQLDPDPNDPYIDQVPLQDSGKVKESERTLTRIAYNPLTGYYGGGADSRLDEKSTKLLKAWWKEYNRRRPAKMDDSIIDRIVDDDAHKSAHLTDASSSATSQGATSGRATERTSNDESADDDDLTESEVNSTPDVVANLLRESIERLQRGDDLMSVAPMLLAAKQKLSTLRRETEHRLSSLAMASSKATPTSSHTDTSSSTSSSNGQNKEGNADSKSDESSDATSELVAQKMAEQREAARILDELEQALAEMERELTEAYPESAAQYAEFLSQHADEELTVEALGSENSNESAIKAESDIIESEVVNIADASASKDNGNTDDSSGFDEPTLEEPDLTSDFREQELDADLRRQMGHITTAPARQDAVWLVSGVNEPAVESQLCANLNELCPPLESSAALQDKALRVALSVGIDVVSIDSDVLFALKTPCALKPSDLITVSDTEHLFGQFKVPVPK